MDLTRPGSWRSLHEDVPGAHNLESKPDGKNRSDKTEQQWVQCEKRKCGKWRKVPFHIDPESLPDKWTCAMNYWDTQ